MAKKETTKKTTKTVKKTEVKKPAAKKQPVKKAAEKKPAAKKAEPKKQAAKKPATKKTAVKAETTKKAAAGKAAAAKPVTKKKADTKAAASKATEKKTKVTTAKAATKKATANKTDVKKTAAKKQAAQKTVAKKTGTVKEEKKAIQKAAKNKTEQIKKTKNTKEAVPAPEKKRKKDKVNETAEVKAPEAEDDEEEDDGNEKMSPAVLQQLAENAAVAISQVVVHEEDADGNLTESITPKLDDKSKDVFVKKYMELMMFAQKKDNMLEYQEIIDAFTELKLEDEQYDVIIAGLEMNDVEVLRVSYEDNDEVPDEELEMIEDDDELDPETLDLTLTDSVNIEDHVRMYLKEIGKVPLLTADEEIDLAKRMEKGIVAEKVLSLKNRNMINYITKGKASQLTIKDDQLKAIKQLGLHREEKALVKGKTERELNEMMVDGEYAKNKLAEANLRLVVSIANRYVGRGMLFLDLIQEGNLGLIKAVEKFDFRKGFKFSTYATWWIRQAITRAIADQARTIRIPVHMVETINKLVRVSRQLLQKLGREPSPEEIAEEMDISVDRVREIIKISQEPVSLETPIGEEEDSHLGDFIQDDNVPVPADAAAFTLLKEQLQDVLSTLTEREQKVLRLRFGLDDGRARTLEEVGREFNVTRERIRQIEAKALRKLRHPSRSRKLKDYLD